MKSLLKKEDFFRGLFYAAFAYALMASLANISNVPNIPGYINHLAALIQAKLALAEGQFPLRLLPFNSTDWPYPFFQFNSPTTYTIGGWLYQHLGPENPQISMQAMIWFALMIGGIYMNRLSYWFVPAKPIALLAGVVYLTSPYCIIVFNDLGDLSEILALGILPVILFYLLQALVNKDFLKNFILISFLWYGLITIHLPTALYAAFFAGLLLIFICLRHRTYVKNFFIILLAFMFGGLLAAWYLVPIILIGKYLAISQSIEANIFYSFHPYLPQLLFQGASLFSKRMICNHPAVGWLILSGFALSAYGLWKNKNASHLIGCFDLLILFGIAFFLIWSPFNIWQYLPSFLLIGQYSWRLLGQLIWIGSILFAYALADVFGTSLNLNHILFGLLIIAVIIRPWLPTVVIANFVPSHFFQHPFFTSALPSYKIDPKRYLPTMDSSAPKHLTTLSKKEMQNFCKYQNQHLACQFPANPTIETISLPLNYFPQLLSIDRNGHKLSYQSQLSQNNLQISFLLLPNQVNQIDIHFQGIAWANRLSQICWITWLLGLFGLGMYAVSAQRNMLLEKKLYPSLNIE